jgi:hypothetical protein
MSRSTLDYDTQVTHLPLEIDTSPQQGQPGGQCFGGTNFGIDEWRILGTIRSSGALFNEVSSLLQNLLASSQRGTLNGKARKANPFSQAVGGEA